VGAAGAFDVTTAASAAAEGAVEDVVGVLFADEEVDAMAGLSAMAKAGNVSIKAVSNSDFFI
jgi:hypothetical protein